MDKPIFIKIKNVKIKIKLKHNKEGVFFTFDERDKKDLMFIIGKRKYRYKPNQNITRVRGGKMRTLKTPYTAQQAIKFRNE